MDGWMDVFILTISGWDDNGPHELGRPGVQTLSVQNSTTGADLPGSVVDDVIGVCWTDAVRDCPILSIISVQRQHLHEERKEKNKLINIWHNNFAFFAVCFCLYIPVVIFWFDSKVCIQTSAIFIMPIK